MDNKSKLSRKLLGITFAMTLAGASAASAATFDFQSMADNAGDANYIGATEGNWADLFPGNITIDGITLAASGSNENMTAADAFFDKGNAGLGVCSSAGGCASGVSGATTSDDNVSGTEGGETLTLDFGQAVNFSDIVFRAGNHTLLTGSLSLVGLGTLTVSGGAVTAGLGLLKGQSIYNFKFTGDQFYIDTASVAPVPLPASILLLGLGIAGMGAVRRRKSTNS